MNGNFTFHNPTRLHFGENAMDALKDELASFGLTVMLAYGGGSIKKNGIYDIMSHIMEQYFSGTDDTTSDYIAEGLMKSLWTREVRSLRRERLGCFGGRQERDPGGGRRTCRAGGVDARNRRCDEHHGAWRDRGDDSRSRQGDVPPRRRLQAAHRRGGRGDIPSKPVIVKSHAKSAKIMGRSASLRLCVR